MRLDNREILKLPKGNNFKTLKLIDKIARKEKDHDFIQRSIEKIGLTGSRKDIKRFFCAVYKLLPFSPDPAETQYIRTVNRQLKDRRANCVDYTLLLSSFLRAVKVPHSIRMVRTNPDGGGFNHIYVVLLDGTPIDPVIGQAQDGSEPLKPKRKPPVFGKEVPYFEKYDRKII